MDLLNEIGTKAGEAFQTIKDSDATKKAKSYAEIPGLTVQIGKQKSIIKKTYQEIGEAYYNAHKDDAEDNLAPMIETITQALEAIEELKTEIENRKKYDPSQDREADVASAEETAQAQLIVSADDVTSSKEEEQEI